MSLTCRQGLTQHREGQEPSMPEQSTCHRWPSCTGLACRRQTLPAWWACWGSKGGACRAPTGCHRNWHGCSRISPTPSSLLPPARTGLRQQSSGKPKHRRDETKIGNASATSAIEVRSMAENVPQRRDDDDPGCAVWAPYWIDGEQREERETCRCVTWERLYRYICVFHLIYAPSRLSTQVSKTRYIFSYYLYSFQTFLPI